MKILLAEDDSDLRVALAEALENDDCRVIQAADGDEAITLLQRERYDLLITDLQMPGCNGNVVATWARQYQPFIEIIFMTGHEPQKAYEQIKKFDVNIEKQRVAFKPVALNTLRALVEKTIHKC